MLVDHIPTKVTGERIFEKKKNLHTVQSNLEKQYN